MLNFKIRKAMTDDCEVIADLSSKLNQQQGMTEWHRPLVDVLRDNFDRVDIYLAESDDKPIGYVAGFTEFNPHNSYFRFVVSSFFVDEAYRRQGVGNGLLTTLMLEKRKDKIQQFSIDVMPFSRDACALYESLGFKKKDSAFINYRLGWAELDEFYKKAA